MIATRGRMVSGRAVPMAASTLPTAPSERPSPSPIHSTPLVKTSAPARITGSAIRSSATSTRRQSLAPGPPPYDATVDADAFLAKLADEHEAAESLVHVQRLPAREPSPHPFPEDLPELLVDRLRLLGIDGLFFHQRRALDVLHAGENVVVATGTASGKTLVDTLALA